LVVVESYQQNNISERLAQQQLSSQPDAAFWLGLMSLDDLSTNTLEAASGSLVPQYAGNATPSGVGFFSFNHLGSGCGFFRPVSDEN
jgi:hypothetical protein